MFGERATKLNSNIFMLVFFTHRYFSFFADVFREETEKTLIENNARMANKLKAELSGGGGCCSGC